MGEKTILEALLTIMVMNKTTSVSRSKFLLLMPVILLVAATCNNRQLTSQQNQQTDNSPQQQTQQTPPAVDETASWQIYNNTRFGFEFKYPGNWYIVGTHSLINHDAQLLSNYKNADSFDLGSTPGDLKSIFFETYDIGKNSILDDLKPKSGLVSFEKFTTSQGLEGRKSVAYLSDAPVGNHTHIYFLKNGLVVSFSLGTGSEDQVKLLEQILSTFKFTK